jgi:DNA-binding transcriptional regulator YhcF (GntR family)
MTTTERTPLMESAPADTGGASTKGAFLFLMGRGYVKLHRSLLDWEWYSDERVKAVFIHLLLRCNWQGGKWRGETVEPGSIITSTVQMASELGMSRSALVRALEKIKSSGELDTKSDSRWTRITLRNWAKYQDDVVIPDSKPNSKRTATEQRNGQQSDTIEEGKKAIKEEQKKVLFSNSELSNLETAKAQLQQLVAEGVNIDHYRRAILNWSDTKGEKRTDRGWLATFRQWTDKDREKGELKLTTTAKAVWNPRA